MVSQQPEPIAVVGSACRFAGGVNSSSSLWELLRDPRDVLKEIPKERFDLHGYYHPDGAHHGTTNVRHSYMLDEDLRLFDAKFFNLSNNEADSIDPQQRLLMETVYEAMESGGLTIESLKGSDTAVYVGVMAVDYQDVLMRDVNSLPTYFATGISRSIISNRISYFFDWHGPSMTIDTACSSSMIAVHQGVQALRTGDSRVAMACGTELILGPESKMNLLSPTGRSRMWDSEADGYARGDGVATIVMKKLSDAIADGDHIECIIRETGINQDGRGTGGLTVPSSEAQASLIQRTYERAGLNLKDPRDQPQYFEAHGTGTKVGDPREASAIQQCFGNRSSNDDVLYVGSIKTVIGHTEGTAGLAGLLKGSLALQNSTIPPNLLFNSLNPSIEPFYNGLHVPTSAKQWPKVPEGSPRRVSINSFGFGGTNAHAILESFESPQPTKELSERSDTSFTPFTFSAGTEASLAALLRAYSDYLKATPTINLRDLAWTLQSRRSALPIKMTISATSVERLISKIDAKLAGLKQNSGTSLGVRSNVGKPRALGIFTGQGAQWPTMGKCLIESSAFFRERIEFLENSLSSLPESDRPSWKISEELMKDAETSRLSEAELSQPLCTAIQIALVDLLRSAGITFESVVGHSSGEIAAAYAADFISAHDAIRIAYYRGLYAKLARGREYQKGAMLAVGTSWEDATELAELPVFNGRVAVAAHNSSASVTMSGDLDAITQVKKVFEEEKKFVRLLKVDTAYHSHHMLHCSDAYVESLRACKIQVNKTRDTSCTWYSSVIGGQAMDAVDTLQDTYWVDNMVNAVLFMEAVTSAASKDLNIAIEVGPHPALKGPASQNISDVRDKLEYCGVLSRGDNDIEAFSDALGFVWAQLGSAAVNFESFASKVSPSSPSPKLVTGLPAYQWDKSRVHWHESRRSKKIRERSDTFHELLGVRSPDGTDQDWRWTNLLKANEIPWLNGHQLQGQTVFPAAGYVVMALEAAKRITQGKDVKLFEVHNLIIGKAITFEDDANFAVETLVTLTAVSRPDQPTQTAEFSCYSCPNTSSGDMELMASGSVKVIFGTSSSTTLSSSRLETTNMSTIDTDRFYSSLLELGYGYADYFRGMSSLKRKLNQASAMVTTYDYATSEDSLMVHPTTLDVAFQAALLAQSTPGDQHLWSLHVPTSIRCVRVNPHLCDSLSLNGTTIPIDAALHESESIAICGNVDMYSEDGENTLIQVENLTLVPFSPATVADDRRLFSYTEWGAAAPNGNEIMGNDRPSSEEIELASLCERLSYYYLRKWKAEITDEEWASSEWHHRCLQDSTNHLLSVIATGKHPCVKKEWESDTEEQIKELISEWYPKSIDLRLISAVGENIPDVVRGKTTMLEHMLKDNMLDDLYKKGIGFAEYNSYLAKMVKQIVHRYPHMNILEIGAGTGGATKSVLQTLGDSFSSYTYTDISTGFFEKASELFKKYSHKMIFKPFDAEKTPAAQGYVEHSYDMVIASNVLHATKTMKKTMENTRRLLKPGGYLMLLEITNNGPIRIANMTGGLSGWWIGSDDGRKYAPTMTPATWNSLLRKTGFSGISAITPEKNGLAWPFSIIASQAVDDRVDFLRKPLSSPSSSTRIEELIILGNKSLETSRIAEDVADLVGKYCDKVTVLEDLPTDDDMIASMSTFVNLVDLEEPIFKNLTEDKINGLKRLFELSKNVLWLTKGARVEEPYHMSSIGFGRGISHEMPHMRLQFLDVPDLEDDGVSRIIAESVLRLHAAEEWAEKDANLDASLLWSREPELVFEKGQFLVPRVLPNEDQNARLNSLRRSVTKTVNPRSSPVEIRRTSGADGSAIFQENTLQGQGNKEDLVHVSHSTFSALRLASDTFLFLAIGTSGKTNSDVLCLSESNSSVVVPLASFSLSPQDLAVGKSRLLSETAAGLLADALLSGIPSNSSLLVHEQDPDDSFDSALANRAAAEGIKITFTTAASDIQKESWINLNPGASERMIQKKLSSKYTHFLDLSVNEMGARISKLLPSKCKQIDVSSILQHQSEVFNYNEGALLQALTGATERAKTAVSAKVQSKTISLGEIGDSSSNNLPTSVVDWTIDDAVTIHVQPLEPERLFRSDKTYLLVGLTGQIGQSICEWMARNGAGTICLTSRNPNVDERWIQSFEGSGTTVKIFAMDITDKQDLLKVYDEIKNTLPPIAGVANAAMVLHDTLFSEMSLEQMEKVLRPKIDGTNYLDELFYDADLDFFILFSSLSSVVGNSGQSNYAAASTYLTTLAAQRRKRGLAGSAFDIGRVVGIGYVERAGQVVHDQLTKYGYMPISESDFHQMFAETILAGRPGSDALPEVTTGIRAVRSDEEVKVPWFDNPRFSHCIVEAKEVEVKKDGKKTVLPVSVQLEVATSKEEALEILKECFATKLQVILQLSADQVNHDVPLVELGIDSLVAVEVRSWFLKELKTDMPVLKVLGGGSVTNLCQQTLDKLPEKMLPNLGAEKPSKPKATNIETKATPKAPESTVSGSESSQAEGTSTGSSGSHSPSSTGSPPTTLAPPTSFTDLGQTESTKNTETTITKKPRPSFIKSEQISFAQSRFWFLRLLLEDQTTFNVTFYYKVLGDLRINDLERAFRMVGQRHEGLRTCFVADDIEADLANQGVLKESSLKLERKKISSVEEVAKEYETLKNHIFDLESGVLMRAVLLTLSPTEHYLLFNYHHILMDGVSYQVFISDLEKAYKRQSLGAQPRQFPEFSRAQRSAFENGDMADELKFWQGVFPDPPPILPLLPMAHTSTRAPMKTFNVNQTEYRLDPELAARVKQAAKAQRSTTFHFYLAVFKVMLFRLGGIDDLTIGIADANRNDDDVMGTIGLFLNLLTLRFKHEPNQKFADAIVEARMKTYGALEHSRLPFDVLLKELKVPRSSSYSPIFQAFFDYRQGAQEKQAFGNCEFEVETVHPGRTAYDITLDVTDSAANSTLVMFRTQTSLYDQAATDLLMKTYTHLLEVFSRDVSLQVEQPPLFSDDQLNHALGLGKGPDMQSDWPETLPHRIDQIAQANSDTTAIKDGLGRVLSYRDMINRVEAIAEALLNNGVAPGSRVLVFQQATSDWPCSLLAIMRVGAVYVPLDLRNPLERLAGIAGDCQPSAILADGSTFADASMLDVPEAKIINISLVPEEASIPIPNSALPDSPAAILYTSGSTGKPKGIMIKHSGLRNEMEGYTKTWNLGAERVLQQSAFTFNHSSDQMFTGLVNGGMVYMVPWSKRGDPLQITKLILEQDITYTKATPSEYLLWLQYGLPNLQQTSSWRFAFGGGEQLQSKVTEEFAALNLPQLRFFNSYGPAEITISSTKMEIPYRRDLSQFRIPCGFSLPNYVAYILDEAQKPVPAGMPGEIVLGGAGVSLGYLNNKELTDRHFIPNPYATSEYIANGWTRMYRTGDIGHLRDDGALVFHNRMAGDTQIKIRGLRIELGDIESNIVRSSTGVLREAIVTLHEGDPEFLVAHVVFASQHHVTDKEEYLQNLLAHLPMPQYMIPVMAIPLDRLPLSNHSKVDRKAIKALPLPERTKKDENNVELSETMVQLKRLWEDVLNNKKLGLQILPSTSFFSVGGNSLLIVRLQSRIRDAFNIVVRLVELLGGNTLGEMAQKIEEGLAVELVDWEKETELPDLPSVSKTLGKPINNEQKVVLVTGAGGFLAKYILAQLISDDRVSKIHCVALRPKGSNTPRELVVSSPKIIKHAGNLSEPFLGLSESDFAALGAEVDVILHLGAVRSFWDNYHVLRPSNVAPTKELVKLAASRRIPIHYTSSAGVVPLDLLHSKPGSVAQYPPAQDGSNGYVASRWASERILERAATDLGVPVHIHRFVPAEVPQLELKPVVLDEFVRFAHETKLMPELKGWKGHFEMTPAEDLAEELCRAVVGGEGTGVENFVHHGCGIKMDVGEMREFMEDHVGAAGYERMSGLKWVGRIKPLGFKYFFAAQDVVVENNTEMLESRR
ncbi:hypothetical protein CJF32_00005378 [Rutstroemia sp. NJR-2017a WRK4]|nr:hypothetical protein CJF32_00005378 [Rutstroemia sp. NJR-2017a WRK4]